MSNPPINTHCPWSGKPVTQDSLTQYRGQTVGFCNPGCRDKFEAACDLFDRVMEALPPIVRQIKKTKAT